MGKGRRITRIAVPLLALILEALPIGVRVFFAPGPETRIVRFYPWFSSFTAFGAAVFGAPIAALLTVCLLIAALAAVKKARSRAVPILSGAALLAGLSPLCYVPESFTPAGGCICALLALELVLSLLPEKRV
ncbi:MAG: hypothetical protein IKP17_05055 [Oscillospiraceae bacterium]|nr:hypothetical protein [Oscillospiraceae bacterium]